MRGAFLEYQIRVLFLGSDETLSYIYTGYSLFLKVIDSDLIFLKL